MNGDRHSSSAESPPARGPSESGKKRKAEEGAAAGPGGSTQTRAKRNRYISIACNECKRRKIKCNGETPCLRCGNLNLECQYAPNCCSNGFKDSEEFRQMNAHISSLQEQVDNLYANMNSLRESNSGSLAFSASSERGSMPQPPSLPPTSPLAQFRPARQHPLFRGPTSSAFSLDVAKNTLHNMGYQGMSDEGAGTQDATPVASPPVRPSPLPTNGNSSWDPIWAFNKEEMLRLCRVYEEEIGLMYPIVNIDQVMIHGKNLYAFIASALQTGLAKTTEPGQGIHDLDSCVLKMVLAVATITESHGQSDIGNQLFESIRSEADRMLHSEAIDVKSLPLLVLVAMYHFHCDEEGLAWRIIGQVVRMCIELGLHRRDALFRVVVDEAERIRTTKLFWSIYVLDRRWSFGTGLPFALQDADIDPTLPEPLNDVPYLNSMISYCRIGSKVWRSVCVATPVLGTTINVEDIGYLDYQIQQWQKSIPNELQLPTTTEPQSASRGIHRLQILLYLRANQMRMVVYRPVLHSAGAIQENMDFANTVVEVAKDTIRALTHLNQTTDIYRSQQVCFNYFLISALAIIFLASCHAPVHFSSICRSEFYMALDLVKGFSNKSWVSKRLWKTIKGLKEVGPKLGLSPDNTTNNHNDIEDPHSSAALAMAGLAGHEISALPPHFGHETSGLNGASSNSPMNGFQMSYEMTNLFEAALGSVGMNGNGNTTNGSYVQQIHDGPDPLAGIGIGSDIFGGDKELYNHMRDLF